MSLVAVLLLSLVTAVSGVARSQTAHADIAYQTNTCDYGRWADTYNAAAMLDMWGPTADYGLCPITQIFIMTHGYYPVRGFETNVAEDYGWVMVQQSGECSWSPDTAGWYDFQIPCKAHDYCYDLRRAVMGTVTKQGCDDAFASLMNSHCSRRSVLLRTQCFETAALMYAAVVAGGNADPNPVAVRLNVRHAGKCAAVAGGSYSTNVAIRQETCTVGVSQSQWKFLPVSGYDGWYYMKPQHGSGYCVADDVGQIEQHTCTTAYQNRLVRFVEQPGLPGWYTFRFYNTGKCIDVPASTMSDINLMSYTCYATNNQLWFLIGG